jgi:hypothetical protein
LGNIRVEIAVSRQWREDRIRDFGTELAQ